MDIPLSLPPPFAHSPLHGTPCVPPPYIAPSWKMVPLCRYYRSNNSNNNEKLPTPDLFVSQLLSDLQLQLKTFFIFIEITVYLLFCTTFPNRECWLTAACFVDVSTTVYSPPVDSTPHPCVYTPLPERPFTIDITRVLSMGFYSIRNNLCRILD